ncbi:MAG TPA: histidine--tRNA ligase [Candidatus Kapabacteria bacterium]|nr:histidine--tRNA ligase [Candidatus Kapabacteria bacterium]
MNIKAPRGTKDILPPESALWQEIERAVDETARVFGYDEIRTPMFEPVSLFKRSVGETSDIVSKEMYLFTDKGGEEMALRPELTASVVRAAIEHNLISQQGSIAKLYYNSAPMFRYERPQMGRQRQFHQFGIELLGSPSALADLQTVAFAHSVYQRLGFVNFELRLNTLGSPEIREKWREYLVAYLRKYVNDLSDDSKRRLETNPIRILDSKNERDHEIVRDAPAISDYLDEADKVHFDTLQAHLTDAGIKFRIDPLLVRGLDYYNRTVFELTSNDLGSQDALCGGGRYDGLVEQLGGPAIPAVGFAAGVERLVIVLQKMRGIINQTPLDAYVVLADKSAVKTLIEVSSEIKGAGFSCTYDLLERSMKAQMREAGKLGARYVVILGADEIANNSVTLKNMAEGSQEMIGRYLLADRLGKS